MTITSTDTQMFGCTQESMDDLYQRNLYRSTLGDNTGSLMLAMSILSDAQHVMACGDTEQARQFINKSKYILSKLMDKEGGQ